MPKQPNGTPVEGTYFAADTSHYAEETRTTEFPAFARRPSNAVHARHDDGPGLGTARGLVSFGGAKDMSSKIAHATEFPLLDRPFSRPLDVIRLLAKGGLSLTIARSVVERIASGKIKGRYYHETNCVYIEIRPEPSAETTQLANGLNVDFDADGNVVGFNIDNASRLGALLRDFIASGATIEDLAQAWASQEDKREEFDQENFRAASGGGPRYLAEIEEILQRAAKSARKRSSISSSSLASN
jgi:uncharacterized protein YuzE